MADPPSTTQPQAQGRSTAHAPLCDHRLEDLDDELRGGSSQTPSVGWMEEGCHPDRTVCWIPPKLLMSDGRVPGPA